jgi:hypothetical protein
MEQRNKGLLSLNFKLIGLPVFHSMPNLRSCELSENFQILFCSVFQLMYLYGGLRCMLSTAVELPHLEPGHEGTVMATFIAPPDIGEYIR